MGLSNMTNNTHQIHKFHKKLKQEMFIFQNKVFKVGGLTREEGGGERPEWELQISALYLQNYAY